MGDMDALWFLDDLCSCDKMHVSQYEVLKYKQFVKEHRLLKNGNAVSTSSTGEHYYLSPLISSGD